VLRDTKVIFLEYNCFYMAAICQNARLWLASHAVNNVVRSEFSFDFDATRKNWRRDKESCPSNWIKNGRCPEKADPNTGRPAQPKAYRWTIGRPAANGKPAILSGGDFWPTIDIVPPSNNIIGPDASGNPSGMIYSCDEFPPATWIEGGAGANTRCAAFRCEGTNYKAEQQFQAEAHKALRLYMENLLGKPKGGQVVPFLFRMTTVDNGVPALYGQIDSDEFISAFRRSNDFSNATNSTGDSWTKELHSLSMDEIRSRYRVQTHHYMLNQTEHTLDYKLSMNFGKDVSGTWSTEFGGMIEPTVDMINSARSPGKASNDSIFFPQKAEPDVLAQVPRRTKTYPRGNQLLSNIHGRSLTDTPLLKNATESALQAAIRVVEQAISDSTKLNEARYANVARNVYQLAPDTIIGTSKGAQRRKRRGIAGLIGLDGTSSLPPPLLNVSAELAAAAALVAEADAAGITGESPTSNTTRRTTVAPRAGSFWMEGLARKGTVPWGNDPNYKIFRNVKDYGATGDGKTDDSAAIQKAMTDGNRCGENCHGSTTKNAIVYFPPGTYLVSRSIEMPFGTQAIGDANSRPTILAASRFIGLGVLSTDKYTGGGVGSDGLDEEYYINTANFYRQIRNLIVDVTATRPVQGVAAIHYQIAQATSMQNVDLIAKTGTNQRGMFTENGSGGKKNNLAI
jgi:hypothetical protein